MAKYYKRLLTYYEVKESGVYVSITPLISQTTLTVGTDFRKTSTETEITKEEFDAEVQDAAKRFETTMKMFFISDLVV
jgi:hypothetical protein